MKEISYENDADLAEWCDIINNSYDDCFFDIEKARKYLSDHLYLHNTKTFIFSSIYGEVATVSIGTYKDNDEVGGDFRIGTKHEFQGKGIGRLCILFAYSKLHANGIKKGESIICSKRKTSLRLHFSLGFRPQYNTKYHAYKGNYPFLKNLNFVLKYILRQDYRSFLNRENQCYKI